MGLNDSVTAERPHIGFFGLRNAGKSSVVNAVTGQELSIVSPTLGTTTDPVQKNMELLPLGPVVIIDTPGLDDVGDLGLQRAERAIRMLDKTDIAILVADGTKGLQQEDKDIIAKFEEKKIPYIIAYNKCDLFEAPKIESDKEIYISAKDNIKIFELKEMIAKAAKLMADKRELLADVAKPGDVVVLVTPIDSSAPKGRIILPQQQTIRALLDLHATAVVTQDTTLKETLGKLKEKPNIVITDSKVFDIADRDTPEDVPLTSFSVLFARYKGDLLQTVEGAKKLKELQEGDNVLIAEGCTHHRQCEDIGTVKLPKMIQAYCGKKLNFSFTSGGEFPNDISKFDLIVHCGGCMLNEKEMKTRLEKAKVAGIPMTNYGIVLAEMHGILNRAIAPFPELAKE